MLTTGLLFQMDTPTQQGLDLQCPQFWQRGSECAMSVRVKVLLHVGQFCICRAA